MSNSAEISKRPPNTRSRIANGSALHDREIDGRTREARRFRDIFGEIVGDLGGIDRLSEGQKQIARRCALLSVECERIEAKSVAGEPFDIELFGKMSDRLGRGFQRLGLKRVARDVTSHSLDDIAREIHAGKDVL